MDGTGVNYSGTQDSDICNKCNGHVKRSNHSCDTDSLSLGSPRRGFPLTDAVSKSEFSEIGFGGDGDTFNLPLVSQSNSNDSLGPSQNSVPAAFQEYLNHFSSATQTSNGLTSKTGVIPTQSKWIILILLTIVTVSIVLTASVLLWNTQEIAKLQISMKKLAKELELSQSQNSGKLMLLQNNMKIIADKRIARKIRTLGSSDCRSIARNCAWDICVGGFPAYMKTWFGPSDDIIYDNYDSDINFDSEPSVGSDNDSTGNENKPQYIRQSIADFTDHNEGDEIPNCEL